MGLIPKLKAALVEQSCLESTQDTYCFWARKFYGFTKREWLTAVIKDRDVQSTVRLAAERRLRKLKTVPRRGEGGEGK